MPHIKKHYYDLQIIFAILHHVSILFMAPRCNQLSRLYNRQQTTYMITEDFKVKINRAAGHGVLQQVYSYFT